MTSPAMENYFFAFFVLRLAPSELWDPGSGFYATARSTAVRQSEHSPSNNWAVRFDTAADE